MGLSLAAHSCAYAYAYGYAYTHRCPHSSVLRARLSPLRCARAETSASGDRKDDSPISRRLSPHVAGPRLWVTRLRIPCSTRPDMCYVFREHSVITSASRWPASVPLPVRIRVCVRARLRILDSCSCATPAPTPAAVPAWQGPVDPMPLVHSST